MVINPEIWANQLSNWLGTLRYRVCSDNKLGRTDLNKMCESMFIPILNRIYGWNLVNKNAVVANEPAIDLEDCQSNVVVQVTSDRSKNKVQHTIEQTAQRYPGATLFMFYIGEKPPKTWNKQTFETLHTIGMIDFSCPGNIITFEDIQRKCANDLAMLKDVYVICQRYFRDDNLIFCARNTVAYDNALKSLSPLAELLVHVDLVRKYCKAYSDENDVYRWSSIRAIMGHQVILGLASMANVFLILREYLFSESDAFEAVTDLEARVTDLLSCADVLQGLPCRDINQYSKRENELILASVRRSYDTLDGFWKCAEKLIRLIVERTTNPNGSAKLFQSWT